MMELFLLQAKMIFTYTGMINGLMRNFLLIRLQAVSGVFLIKYLLRGRDVSCNKLREAG